MFINIRKRRFSLVRYLLGFEVIITNVPFVSSLSTFIFRRRLKYKKTGNRFYFWKSGSDNSLPVTQINWASVTRQPVALLLFIFFPSNGFVILSGSQSRKIGSFSSRVLIGTIEYILTIKFS